MKTLIKSKRSPKASNKDTEEFSKNGSDQKRRKIFIKHNISLHSGHLEKLNSLSSTNRAKNISSLIKSIQKVRIDDPKLVSR